ncbi:hypothetical protein BKA65DRAFT_254011 [Rhexocercosporidium sp. MPI-PUGE-AT-0058]|nr:hypothetical protein BKA65DRAFT_254011 [Rhexocercosporidium sp. MPI-PUGE-AT-0058]
MSVVRLPLFCFVPLLISPYLSSIEATRLSRSGPEKKKTGRGRIQVELRRESRSRNVASPCHHHPLTPPRWTERRLIGDPRVAKTPRKERKSQATCRKGAGDP